MKKTVIKQSVAAKLEEQASQNSQEIDNQPEELNFISKLKKKEAMFVTCKGIFQTANFLHSHALTLLYTVIFPDHWKLSIGQKSGISQNASQNGNKLTWNFPFQMTFQTKNPQGWPQIVAVLYGKDFLGRSIVKGYGNMHFPSSTGLHTRKMRIFETLAPSTAANCCAYLMGYINQLKQPEKVLLDNDGGRDCLQTHPIGQITIKLDVRKYNFQNYGYD